MTLTAGDTAPTAPEVERFAAFADADAAVNDDLSAISFRDIPHIPREWIWADYIPLDDPVILAAKGGTGKGMLACLVIAHVVLGLPFPNEDQALRRPPRSVVYVAGTEDDRFADLAPRFRAAIGHAVRMFGLDLDLADDDSPKAAIRHVYDLSEWPDGSPFQLPGDVPRLAREVGKINRAGGPPVGLVVFDPLSDLLGEKQTISTVPGARKVLKPVKVFARAVHVGVILIHHLTKDGKVSGSPAVVDALRMAHVIQVDSVRPAERVITPVKTNIAPGQQPQRYTVTGSAPETHAAFISSQDIRTERVAMASGTTAAGMRALADNAGPWVVMRQVNLPGRPDPVRDRLDGSFAGPVEAKRAARGDAGRPLVWALVKGMELARTDGADGMRVAYAVIPATVLQGQLAGV